jgi:hypothetical protein
MAYEVKKKIAVDVDDTLYSFNELAREKWIEIALERNDKSLQRGAYCAWGEWRSPADVIDMPLWLQVIDRCHEDAVIVCQKPFKVLLTRFGNWLTMDMSFCISLIVSCRLPRLRKHGSIRAVSRRLRT